MLTFEWNAPPSFGELRGIHTYVIPEFEDIGAAQVKVTLSHTGWGRGEDRDRLYNYFDKARGYMLDNIRRRFESGPIDWSEPQASVFC